MRAPLSSLILYVLGTRLGALGRGGGAGGGGGDGGVKRGLLEGRPVGPPCGAACKPRQQASSLGIQSAATFNRLAGIFGTPLYSLEIPARCNYCGDARNACNSEPRRRSAPARHKHSLRAGWRNMQITRIFSRIISFMLFTVLLSLMYFILKNF
jgi:hypothetical protein